MSSEQCVSLNTQNEGMDLPRELQPEWLRKSAAESFYDRVTEQMESQRKLQDISDVWQRYAPVSQAMQALEQLDRFGTQRSLEQAAISKDVLEMLKGSSIASHAQKLAEQYVSVGQASAANAWNVAAGRSAAEEAARQFEQAIGPASHALDALRGSAISSNAESLLRYPSHGISTSIDEIRQLTGMGSASSLAMRFVEMAKPASASQQMQEMLERFKDEVSGRSQIDTLIQQAQRWSPSISALVSAKSSLDGLLGQFQGIDFDQVEVEDEEHEQAESALQSLNLSAQEQQAFQGFIEQVLVVALAQQKPAVQLMVLTVLYKLLEWTINACVTTLVTTVVTPYANALFAESPQAANKAMQQTVQAAVGSSQLLEDYRYVSSKILIVRHNARAQSPQLGSLQRGMAVKLLKKEKDFSLVLWQDSESGSEIKGWVFSRHLRKFN
jgi:hypothetical protein